MSGTARNRAIVAKAGDGDYVSEAAEAMARVSDALTDVAGAICYLAANQYEGKTPGEKRELATVMFATVRQRFGGIKYDGVTITAADIELLDNMWAGMTGKKLKR